MPHIRVPRYFAVRYSSASKLLIIQYTPRSFTILGTPYSSFKFQASCLAWVSTRYSIQPPRVLFAPSVCLAYAFSVPSTSPRLARGITPASYYVPPYPGYIEAPLFTSRQATSRQLVLWKSIGMGPPKPRTIRSWHQHQALDP